MGFRRLDSLTDLARHHLWICITCGACGRIIHADPMALAMRNRRHFGGLAIARIEKRLRCENCGERQASVVPCSAPG